MAKNSTIMIRIALATILLVTVCADAFAGVDVLKAKLQHRFPVLGSSYGGAAAGAAASGRGYGGYGGGAAASSAAAAGGYPGYYGGSGSAASAAAAASSGRTYGRPVRPTYVHGFNDDPYGEEEPFHPRHRLGSFGSGYHGSAAASAAAASANNVAALNAPVAPLKPLRHMDPYRRHNLAYPRTRYYSPVHGGGAASASSSAASGGYGGFGGAAASSAAAASHGAGYVDEPIEFDQGLGVGAATRVASAATGTYSNDDNGREKSSYKRRTENVHNHEDGHADDNHYYNAQSYGKTDDENMHEAYNKNNEDVEQTPNVYRSKKSGENYVMDYNKARRESGSGVLASDKHSSGFNKNSRRFIENVDQKHKIEGGGVVEHIDRVSAQNLDDADEEIYDSDGLHGRGGGSAAASSAAAAANGIL